MITDHFLADLILSTLDESGHEWAFLHGEERLSRGELDSDLDIVIDAPPLLVIKKLAARMDSNDVFPVVLWRYDTHSWTTFWMSPDLRNVVQLDLTHDDSGVNKYGLRSDILLSRRRRGARWPTVNGVDESIYLVSKRLYKRQIEEASRAASQLAQLTDSRRRCREVLSDVRSREVIRFMNEQIAPRRRRQVLANTRRLLNRVSRPTGVLIRVTESVGGDAPSMRAVVRRLSGALPIVEVISERGLTLGARGLVMRMRPALVFVSCNAWLPAADGELAESDLGSLEASVSAVADILRSTCQRRLDAWTS